uniref:Uncharacterized protein n=1 Tax=Heliothis virescens TaxID=7102 RepID=A0A2A4J1A5_HELVI
MEYQHQPIQPLGPPAPPPQLLPPAPPPPLPSLPQLQHGHAQDDDRWNQYHIWRQHVFVNAKLICCEIPEKVLEVSQRQLVAASKHHCIAIGARAPPRPPRDPRPAPFVVRDLEIYK